MKKSVLVCLFLISFLLPSGLVSASSALGPLSDVVTEGRDGVWFAETKGSTFWLENSEDPGAIRYYYSDFIEADAGGRKVSVSLDLSQASPDGRAGLLYGYQENPRQYFLFVLGNEGVLDVFKRGESGFKNMMSVTFPLSRSGTNSLSIEEDGQAVNVSVNGESKTTLESDGTGTGAVGIAAAGFGRFGFSAYTESTGKSANVSKAPTQKVSSSASAAKFTDTVVRDVSRGNAPAYNVLVPEGWSIEGQFEFFPAFNNVPYFGTVVVKAKDGRNASFMPFGEFTYSDYVPLQFMQPYEGRPGWRQPNSLGQIMIELASNDPKNTLTDIKIISEEPMPELARIAERNAQATIQQIAATNQQIAWSGERHVYNVDARRLVMQYTEAGKRLESNSFAVITSYQVIDGMGKVKIAKWNLLDAYSIAGPVGSNYLADPMLAAVVRSRRINPDWSYAIDQWYANRRQMIVKEGMAKAAAARKGWQDTRLAQSDDVLDISFNGWKSRNASSDRSQANLVNTIHERTTYATPSGGTINLPSFYNHAYTDGQGNYVLHNDANYNLNTDPNFNSRDWTQIQEAR